MTASTHAIELVAVAAAAADSKQATDLVALDVSATLPLADAFLLASGRNERNVIAIASEIEEKLQEIGTKAIRREGRGGGGWVRRDVGDRIGHVVRGEDRLYYQLERLWSDSPVIPIDLPEPTAAAAE